MKDLFRTRISGTQLFLSLCGLLTLAVAYASYSLWRDDVRGREAVAQMCEMDGGPTVFDTVLAPGYLDADRSTPSCAACEEFVGKGLFDFVDWVPPYASLYVEEAGYHRMAISTLGDPACEAYLRYKQRFPEYAVKTPADYGRDANLCLAVERLAEPPPLGFTSSRRFQRIQAGNGYWLGMLEQSIQERSTGRVLAVNRDYLYTAFLTEHLDMGGGGGRLDANCPAAQPWKFRTEEMLRTVLRDENKRGGGVQ